MARSPSRLRFVALGLAVALGAACSTGAPPPSPSPSPTEAPADYASFRAAACAAFQAMDRAIGNPDTGETSALGRQLEGQIESGDVAGAEVTAAQIKAELELGRTHATDAARWEPGAKMVTGLARFLTAFEAAVDAKVERARNPSAPDPQQALEQAGAMEAWQQMGEGWSDLMRSLPAGVVPAECDGVPISF